MFTNLINTLSGNTARYKLPEIVDLLVELGKTEEGSKEELKFTLDIIERIQILRRGDRSYKLPDSVDELELSDGIYRFVSSFLEYTETSLGSYAKFLYKWKFVLYNNPSDLISLWDNNLKAKGDLEGTLSDRMSILVECVYHK